MDNVLYYYVRKTVIYLNGGYEKLSDEVFEINCYETKKQYYIGEEDGKKLYDTHGVRQIFKKKELPEIGCTIRDNDGKSYFYCEKFTLLQYVLSPYKISLPDLNIMFLEKLNYVCEERRSLYDAVKSQMSLSQSEY